MPKKILLLAVLILIVFTFSAPDLPFYSSASTVSSIEVPLTTFNKVVFDIPPLEKNGQIFVSAGDFLPIFGGSADWYKGEGILRGAKVARIAAGRRGFIIEGDYRELREAPFLVDDKLYIPINLALEVLGETFNEKTSVSGTTGFTGSEIFLPPVKMREGFYFRNYPVYDLRAKYDPSSGRLQGELFLAYQNPFIKPLDKLYFNLPANAAYGGGGSISVSKVLINDRPAKFSVSGSRLEVTLINGLAPGRTLLVAVFFTTQVPEKAARLGRAGYISMLAGWYPVLAPQVEGDSVEDMPETNYGEPYYTDASNYLVRISVPRDYHILGSSRIVNCRENKGWKTWTFNSEQPIREFAFVVAPFWQYSTRRVGSVEVVIASQNKPHERVMETTDRALRFFQQIYGSYPYTYLNIVLVPLEQLAGMEYPGFILLSNKKSFNPSVVIHEVSHQWWYNLVGNNTLRESWIDEGLAEYSTLLFYRTYNPVLYRAMLAEIEYLAGQTDLPVNLRLDEYGGEQAYRQAVYSRGAWLWLRLEAVSGWEALRKALAYVQRYYRYEIISPKALEVILTYYGRINFKDFSSYFRN